jgi:hypothetical protein
MPGWVQQYSLKLGMPTLADPILDSYFLTHTLASRQRLSVLYFMVRKQS